MKRIVFAITCILSCAGCIEYAYEYAYISLEEIKGIQITSHGRPDDPVTGRVVVDRDMPLRYELERKTYMVIFGIDDFHLPNVLVSAKSFNTDGLMIEPIETDVFVCGGFNIFYKDLYRRIDDLKAWRYEWKPSFSRNCPVKGRESYLPDQVIKFKVKNQKGEVLGEERLPFTLVENGTYYEIDAL